MRRNKNIELKSVDNPVLLTQTEIIDLILKLANY